MLERMLLALAVLGAFASISPILSPIREIVGLAYALQSMRCHRRVRAGYVIKLDSSR